MASQLGSPLDKTEQCSAWAERPLTQRQLHYAALDALVLLMLLDSLLSAACNADPDLLKGVSQGEEKEEKLRKLALASREERAEAEASGTSAGREGEAGGRSESVAGCLREGTG